MLHSMPFKVTYCEGLQIPSHAPWCQNVSTSSNTYFTFFFSGPGWSGILVERMPCVFFVVLFSGSSVLLFRLGSLHLVHDSGHFVFVI